MLTLPQSRTIHPEVSATCSRFPLWFNREICSPVIPSELLPFTEGKHFLSTKQVPSALILKTAGSQSVTKNRDMLLRSGFTLHETVQQGLGAPRNLTAKRIVGDNPTVSGSLASYLIESEHTMDVLASEQFIDDDCESSGSESSDTERVLEENSEQHTIRFRKSSRYRMKYEDPWKIHAGRILAETLSKDCETVVWSGDGIRLQDPLPPRVLGRTWEGNRKNLIRFGSVVADECKLHLIYKHTHWGARLQELCNVEDENGVFTWARTLRYRINRFLKAKHDPLLTKRQIHAIFSNPSEKKDRKARASRFIELLKTVDGIFLQRYLAYPEEVWTWERFDMFTLGNLSVLLSDEFLDGDLTPEGMAIDSSYSQLKRCRKWFKQVAHSGRLERALVEGPSVPPWCLQFINVWKRVCTARGHRRDYLVGLLSQTRGCGTPPPIVLLQAKDKFLRTISQEPSPLSATARALRRAALQEVIRQLPDSAFTGLSTKSRVTVTTAACWEETRREGGTTEEIRRIIHSGETFDQIPVRDLDTGSIITHIDRQSDVTTGELIFWAALDQVLRTPREELKVAFLTVVKEPGKARSVTKARACLKVVLDLVSKICAEPLSKGIRSSTSGMAAANHGWNLFTDMMTSEMREEVFHIDHREENPYEGYVERTDTFGDLFMSSTDYEEATDRMQHEVAYDEGNAWMLKCGIPALLRGIVNTCCFEPRTVYFLARGPLAHLGTAAPEIGPDIRRVPLLQGVLMGDPLTKVILHLTNVVTRHLGARLREPDFYNHFANGSSAYEAFCRGSGIPFQR